MKKTITALAVLLHYLAIAIAQPLAVKVSPLKTVGQKAIVELTMTNSGTNRIDAARAVCFVLDQNNRLVGQSAQWVIGQHKTSLGPNGQAKFNFVITAPHPMLATNLTAKVSFNRLILQGGKPANPRDVIVVPSTSPKNPNTNRSVFDK